MPPVDLQVPFILSFCIHVIELAYNTTAHDGHCVQVPSAHLMNHHVQMLYSFMYVIDSMDTHKFSLNLFIYINNLHYHFDHA